MADARGYGATLLTGLVGAGAVALGVARPWVSATASQPGLPPVTVSLDGADIVPLAGALGVVMLAAFGAVIATRGWVRRAIGALVVVSSATTLALAVRPPGVTGSLDTALSDHGWAGGPYAQSTDAWRWVVVVGSVACLVAGAAVVRYGGRWPTMGARYDAPAGADTDDRPVPTGAAVTKTGDPSADDSRSDPDLWKAIDQGQDPTLGADAPPER